MAHEERLLPSADQREYCQHSSKFPYEQRRTAAAFHRQKVWTRRVDLNKVFALVDGAAVDRPIAALCMFLFA